MGDLTKDTPKPLLKVKGKTLLEHNLEQLPDVIDEVIIVIGYLGEKIKSLIGREYKGKRIVYVEQKEQKGTAHALFACKDVLKDRFLVLHGDDLYDKEDLAKLIKKPLAVLVWEISEKDLENKKQAAVVDTDSQNEVVEIKERLDLTIGVLANTGAYVLNTDVFRYPLASTGIPANEFGLPQTMMQMVKDGDKFEIVRASRWHKVTDSEDLSSPSLW